MNLLTPNFIIPAAVILAALILQLVLTKTKGLHRTSKLVCPKYHKWSVFNVRSTSINGN
jgi:hypothetical protein